MGAAVLPRKQNRACLWDGSDGEKRREMGFYFIGPRPASICPDSAVFLIMAQLEKRPLCYQTQTQTEHFTSENFVPLLMQSAVLHRRASRMLWIGREGAE